MQTRTELALRFLSRLTLCIGLVACSARSTEAGTLQSAIDQQLALNAQRHGVAGQAVLILHDGKPVYRGSQGLADRETVDRSGPTTSSRSTRSPSCSPVSW